MLGIPGGPFTQPQQITPESEAANWLMVSLSVNVGSRFSISRLYFLVIMEYYPLASSGGPLAVVYAEDAFSVDSYFHPVMAWHFV